MKAGTLEIEFLTNLAQLQSELSTIKRAVGQTMGDAVAQHSQLVRASEALVTSLERQAVTWGKNADQIRKMDVETKALALQEEGLIDLANNLRAAEERLTVAQNGHSSALGFNRTQFMIAESATHRFIDSILAGQSPLKAFAMQAGDFGNVLAMDDGGVAGGLTKVRALINPVTIGVAAATAAVAVGVIAWQSYANAVDKLSNLSQGAGAVIGATGTALEANAEAAANAGNISISSARAIETAYVQMGGIGTSVLTGLTAMTTNFAKATGEDVAGAEKELGAAFQDPSKGAEDLTRKFGTLTAAQIEHIQDLQNQNDLYGAQQALLSGLQAQFDGAADHANILAKAWHFIATEASDAWNSMGKAIDRAMGGGTLLQQIQDLQQQRTSLLASNANGMVPQLDKQIADLQAQLRAEQQKENAAHARSQAVDVLKLAGASTGSDAGDALAANLKKINDLLNDTSNKAGLSKAQIDQLRIAQQQYSHAVETYLPAGEREVKLAQLSAEIAAAKGNPAKIAQLNVQKTLLEQGGKLVTSAQAQAIATANGAAARDKATKSGANHAAMLAREAAATEAQIKNLYGVANAYGVSGAAALIAEARTKAESQAIKQRADVEAAVARQVRLAVAQRVADAAKATASMNDQAAVQERVNAQVEAGLLPAAQASQAIQEQIALLPLLAAQQAAQQMGDAKGAAAATAQIDQMTAAQLRLDAARQQTQVDNATASGANELAALQKELDLIGQTDAARVHALATLKATQEAQAMIAKGLDPAKAAAFVTQQVAIADAQVRLAEAQAGFNDDLRTTADLADSVGDSLSKAFGKAGSSLGDMVKILGEYGARQDEINRQKLAASTDQKTLDDLNKKSADLQLSSLIGITDAAKNLFSEHSKGYKAMAAAEKALTIIQLARTAVSVAEGAANMFATAGPAGFALVGAMLAVMASLGFSGHGGAGAAPTTNTGTGTVLGDDSAKSDSLQRSIDLLKDVDTVTMTTSRDMLTTLKSINSQIGGLASLIVRTGNLGDSATGVTEGFKTSGVGSVLATALMPLNAVLSKIPVVGDIVGAITGVIKSLFGTKTTVVGQGIYGGAQSISDILNGGFDGSTYTDIQKKKKFLGITTSTKYSTQYGNLDAGIEDQFTKILKGFYDAIGAAAPALGKSTNEVESKLDSFVVSIGKIDLNGLTGAQIQEKLQAVFGAAADSMAQAAVPGLEKFQAVGEGYFETLTRVATTIDSVTTSLDKLGLSTKSLGIDASMNIAGMFDSAADYTSAADNYFSTYYTQAEQAAAMSKQLGAAFSSLGLSMPDSIASFRALVDAQDLSTAAGQQAYAELLKLAPAFAQVANAAQSARSAADVQREHDDLQKQLLEAQGDTAGIRAMELAALDASNRAIQQHIWDLQDEQAAEQAATEAAQAAAAAEQAIAQEREGLLQQLYTLQGDTAKLRAMQLATISPVNQALQQQIWALSDAQDAAKKARDLASAWQSVGDSIMAEIERIRGLNGTGDQSYASLAAQFAAATAKAQAGDQNAANSLPELSKALLDAAATVATSQQQLTLIQGQTAASLQQTYDMIAAAVKASNSSSDAVLGPDTSDLESQSWWQQYAQSNATIAASNDNTTAAVKSLSAKVDQLVSDQRIGHAGIASGVNKIAKTLVDVTGQTGGASLSVTVAS